MNCKQVLARKPVLGSAAHARAATREAGLNHHPGREQAHAAHGASRHPN